MRFLKRSFNALKQKFQKRRNDPDRLRRDPLRARFFRTMELLEDRTLPSVNLPTYIQDLLDSYSASFQVTEPLISSASLGDFLELENLTLTADATLGGGGWSGSVTLSADSAVLFPGTTFSASLTSITGTYTIGAGYEFTIADLELNLGEALTVTSEDIDITYAPGGDDDQTLATIADAKVTSARFANMPTAALSNFALRADGFSFDSFNLESAAGSAPSIGGFLATDKVTLTASDFDVAFGASPIMSGSVGIAIDGLSLFPEGGFVEFSSSAVSAKYDFANFNGTDPTGELTVTVSDLEFTLGEALALAAEGDIVITPGADTIATVGKATLSSPMFTSLGTVEVTDLVVTKSGFSLGNLSWGSGGPVSIGGDILTMDDVDVTVSNFVLDYASPAVDTKTWAAGSEIVLSHMPSNPADVVITSTPSGGTAQLLKPGIDYNLVPQGGTLKVAFTAGHAPAVGDVVDVAYGFPQIGGSVSFAATGVALFPSVPILNLSLGSLTGGFDFGDVASPGALELHISDLSIPLGDAIALNFGEIDLRPGAATMFHAVDVAVVPTLFSGFAPFELPTLDITQTGFALGDFTLPTADVSLGGFMEMTGASLAVNDFTVDRSASPVVSGTIDLTIGSLTLFPGNAAVTSTIAGVSGSFDFADLGALTIEVDSFSLSLFSQITLAASNITFTPALDTIATIDTASITFTPLNGLVLDVEDMEIRKSGFSIGSASFSSLPDITLGSVLSLTGLSASLTDFDYTRVQEDASEDTTWNGATISLQHKPASLAGVAITSQTGTDDPIALVRGVDYKFVTTGATPSIQFTGHTPANGDVINVSYSFFGADALKGVVSLGAGTSSLTLGSALSVSIASVDADYDLATKELHATLDEFDLNIAGFANLSIDSAALAWIPASDKTTKMLLGATGVTAFIGTTGSNAVGVSLEDGELALAVFKSAAGVTTYAVEATGTVSLTGLPEDTLSFTSGLTTFRKSTAGAVHEVIAVDDVPANDLHLDFDADETSARGSGLSLTVGSFLSLSADFAFQTFVDGTTTYVLIGATDVDATLAAGTVSLTVDDASFGLILKQGAAANSGTYAMVVDGGHDSLNGIPGFTLESDGLVARIRQGLDVSTIAGIPTSIATPSGTVNFDFSDLGTGTDDVTDVQGHVKIAIDGFASIEGDFGFQKYVAADKTVTLAIGAKDVDVVLGTETTNVTVSDATLGFITQNGKFALVATGDAKLNGVTGLTLEATDVLVRVRKGLDPDTISGLPVIQTSGGDVTLDFDGLGDSDVADFQGHVTLALDDIGSIEGDFGFQSYQDGVTGAKQIAIGATNLTAIVGTDDVNVTVANASFGFVMRPGTGKNAATYALIVRGSDTPSDTSLNGVDGLELNASGLLVRVRKGLDLSGSSGFPSVIHTSGGDVVPDFSGLGSGSTDVVDVQGAVSLTVADVITVEGEFGFQQYTSGKDKYFAIGLHGSVTVAAGDDEIGLHNAGIAVMVKKPAAAGSKAQFALQVTGSDDPDDMTFDGPGGLHLSAANLLVRVRRGLDLSTYPAGVPTTIQLPAPEEDATDPDIVMSAATGDILLANTGVDRDSVVVESSTDGTNFTAVAAADYTLGVDPSGQVTLAFETGHVPANGTTIRISYSYRPQPTTITANESIDADWSTDPSGSLEFIPANPDAIQVTSTVGGESKVRVAGTDYTLGTDSSGHTTITFLAGHLPDDGTSVSVSYGYRFPQPLTLDFGGLGSGTTDITDLQGHVRIAVDGFASLEGDFGIQVYQPAAPGKPVFLIGGTNISAVLGTEDVNVSITDAKLGVMIANGKYALVAGAGDIALNGVDGLTLEAGDLTVRVKSGLDPATVVGFPTKVLTPGGEVDIDFTGLPAGKDVMAIEGHITIGVSNFVSLEGDFSFTQATSGVAPNKTTKILVGASNVDAFIGAADPVDPVGVRLNDASLALAIYKTQGVPGSKYALQASSGIELVGILPGEATLSGTATVAINKTGGLAVNGESIPNAPAFTFTSGNVLSFGGHLTFAVGSDFSLEGDFSVTKSVSGNITKTLIGAANITTSAGSDVADDGGATFTLDDGRLGVVLYRNTLTNTSLGYALNASAHATATVGSVSAGATLNIRRNSTTTAQNDTVTAGGTTIPIAFTAAETFKAGKAFQSISLSDVSLNIDDSIVIQAATGAKNIPAPGAESTVLTGVSVRLQDPDTEQELFTISADGAVFTDYKGKVTASEALAGGVTAIGTKTLIEGPNFDYTLNAAAGSVTVNFNPGKFPVSGTMLRVAYQLASNPGVYQWQNVVAGASQANIVVNVAGIDASTVIVSSTPATAPDWVATDKSLFLTGVSFTLGSYISFHAESVDIQHYTVSGTVTNVFQFRGASIAFLDNGTPMASVSGNVTFTYVTGSPIPANNGFQMVPNSLSLTDYSFLGQTAEIAAGGTSPPPASPPGSPPPPPPPPGSPPPPPPPGALVRTLGPLTLVDPTIELSGFAFDPSGKLGAVIAIGAKSATVTAGTTATATFTTLTGRFEIGAQFDLGDPLSAPTDPYAEFRDITIGNLKVELGQYVTLNAANVKITPAAGPDEDLISFGTGAPGTPGGGISATLKAGTVNVTGSATNFAIQGDGDFVAKTGFTVSVAVGDATSLGVPGFIPLGNLEVALKWADFNGSPDKFLIQLSADVNDIPGLPGVTVTGSITNMVIDPQLVAAGEMPIISVDGASVSVSGNLVGGQVSGSLVFGVVRFDANGAVVDGLGNLQGRTTPGVAPFKSAFYTGIAGNIEIGGTLSFGARIGISQFGLMEIYVEAGVPVPLGPTGLFLSDFRGGIRFGTTFPDLAISNPPDADDALQLRQPAFTTPDKLTAAQWENQLRATVARQYKANPTGGFSTPVGPFIIQAGATIYAANKAAFRVDGDLFIDSSGKILVLGTGVFGNNLSVGVKLYTDLSDVFAGTSTSASVLYLMETPAQPNDLALPPTYTVYGVLTISDLPGAFQMSIAGAAQFNLMNALVAKVEATITLTFTADSFNITLSSGQFTIPAIQADPLASAAGTLTIKTAPDGSTGMWGGFLLVPNGEFLLPFGIDIDGQLFVKINTTSQLKTVTVNLGSGQTQDLSLAPQSFSLLLTGNADFIISSKPVFRLAGAVAMDITNDHLAIFASAKLRIGPDLNNPMIQLDASGLIHVQLVAAPGIQPGFAAKITLTAGTGTTFPGGVSFNTRWLLVANTTLGDVTYTIPTPLPTTPPSQPIPIVMGPDYASSNPLAITSYEVSGPAGERQLSIPKGAPADGLSNYKTWSASTSNAYFIVLGRGNVTIASTITMVGNMNVRATVSGGNLSFTMVMDAKLDVKAGQNTVFSYQVAGGLTLTNAGVAAALAVNYSAGFSIPGNLGFRLNAGFVLELNTTGQPQSFNVPNFGTISIPSDQLVLVHGFGHLTMLGSVLDFYGSFDITIQTNSLKVAIDADITFLRATFHADGFAGIYYGPNPGIAMRINLGLPGGAQGIAPISALGNNFVISGAFSVELNTSSAPQLDQNNVAIPTGFKVKVQNLGVYIYGFNTTGSISVGISNAGFDFDVNLTLDLFGLASINVTGYYHHDGSYLFKGSAGFQFGDHIFGIGGTVSLTIGNNQFAFAVSGWAAAFGIEISAHGGIAFTGSSVDITVGFQVTIVPAVNIDTPDVDMGLFTIPGIHIHTPAVIVGKDATFHLGTIAAPPAVAQVIPPQPPPTPPHLAGLNGSNALVLFLGQDVGSRINDDVPPILTPAQPAENYVLTRVAGDAGSTGGRQTIMVSALNFQQIYANVASILVSNTLGGNDTITIDSGITVPASITLGSGNNVINTGGGTATVVVTGPGSNQIAAGNNATITVQSGATGTNQITAGTGSNITISASGGTGANLITAGASSTVALAGTANNQASLTGGGNVTISGTGRNTVSVSGGMPTVTIAATATNNNSVSINTSFASTVNVNGGGGNTVSTLGAGASTIAVSGNGANQITTGGTAGGAASTVNLIGSGNNVVSTGAGPVNVFDRGTGANTISGGSGGGTLYYGTTGVNGTGPGYTVKGPSSLTTGSGNFAVIASGYAQYQLSDYGLKAGSFNPLLLSGVRQATLNGLAAGDNFTVAGWSGNATINGFSGTDVIDVAPRINAVGVDYVLTDSSLKLGATQTLVLGSIETANLVGATTGNNTFTITDWTGDGTLKGPVGTTNTVIAANDVAFFTLSDSLLTRSDRGGMGLAGIQTANLTGGAGQNTFTVTGWTGTANLNGLNNSDTYNLALSGTGTGTFNVTDTGTGGTDTLNVTASGTTQVTATSVRVGTQRVNYGTSGIEVLNVFGGASGLTYNVQSTNAGIASKVETLGNLNTINVSSTAGNVPAAAGNLNGIQGALAVNVGSGANNLLRVSDFAGLTPKTVTLTNGSISGFAPAQITYSAAGGGTFANTTGAVDGITLEGSNLASLLFNILSTLLGSTTKVIGSSRNDGFFVGTAGQSLGQILGQLSVDGLGGDPAPVTTLSASSVPAGLSAGHSRPAGDVVNFNDQGDAGSFGYSLSGTGMTRGSLPQMLYANFETVNLNAALGAGTVNVSNTAAGSNTTVVGSLNATPTGTAFNVSATGADGNTTFVAGTGDSTFKLQSTGANGFVRLIGKDGNDAVVVSSGAIGGTRGNADAILGTLQIAAGAGANRLTIDDFTSANLNSDVRIDSDAIAGLAPANIFYSATGGSFVNGDAGILIRGTDATVNAFNIRGTLGGSTTTVEGGSLNDAFHVGTSGLSLAQVQGKLTVDGLANSATPTTTLNASSAAAGVSASHTLPVGDTVNFNDQGDAGGHGYTLTANTLNRGSLAQMVYTHAETVNVNMALGAGAIDVAGTAASVNTTVTGSLNAAPTGDTFNIAATGDDANATFIAGTGDSTFHLESTGAGSFNRILGNGGDDAVLVSSNAIAGTRGDTDGILGTLVVDAGAGNNNQLTIDDFTSANLNGDVNIDRDAVTGLAPADIYYSATGGHFVNGDAGILIQGTDATANSFDVRSTLVDSSITVQGGSVNDVFNIGDLVDSLSQILGRLSLDGRGNDPSPTTTLSAASAAAGISASNTRPVGDTVNFDDHGDAGGQVYTLTANTLDRSGLPQSSPDIAYGSLETVNLNTALGASTIHVTSTAAGSNTTVTGSISASPTGDVFNIAGTGANGNATFIAGTGDSTFNLQSAGAGSFNRILGLGGNDLIRVSSNAVAGTHGNTEGILGTLSVDAGAGSVNRLILDDFTGATTPNATVHLDAVTGLAPANIYYAATGGSFTNPGLANGIQIFGSDAGNNVFHVRSTLAGSTTQIDGGGANDRFNVSSDAGTNLGTLAGIRGDLTVLGGTGPANRLIVSDFGNTDAAAARSNVIQTETTIGGTRYIQLQNFAGDIGGGTGGTVINYIAAGGFNDGALEDGISLFGSNALSSTFNVRTTLGGSTTKITGGAASDYVLVSSTANANGDPDTEVPNGTLDGIAGNLTVEAKGGSANRLIVSDTAQTATPKSNVTQDVVAIGGTAYQQVSNFAGGRINYIATGGGFNHGTLEDGVRLDASSALPSTFNVRTSLGGSTTKITTGSAADYVLVSSTANANGDPDNAVPNGTLDGIAGNLTVEAKGGSANRLIVSDTAQTATPKSNVIQDAFTIGGTEFQRVRNFAAGNLHYIATGGGFNHGTLEDGIRLDGSSTLSSTFNVQTTLGGSTTKITGGAASDYVLVSSNANTTGDPDTAVPNDTLDGIAGNLTVEARGGSANRLIVSDTAQTATPKSNVIQDAFTIGGTEFQRVRNFAAGNLHYIATGGGFNHGALEDGIRLDGSSTLSSTFNVQTTLGGSTTKITGGAASDYVVVSSNANTTGDPHTNALPGGTLNGINGNLTVEAGGGTQNRLIVSDIGQSVIPKTNVLQVIADIGGTTFEQIQNFAGNGNGPVINYLATGGGFNHTAGTTDFADGIHLAGSQSRSTTFTFRNSLGGSTLMVDGGLANDNVFVGSPPPNSMPLANNPADSGNLDLIQGQIVVVGNGGSDALVVNDFGASGAFNYLITPNQIQNDPTPVKTVPNVTIPPARTFAGVIYNASGTAAQNTVTTLRVDGTDDVNIFATTPSTIATYTIDGNLTPSGIPISGGGDYLKLDTTHFADKIGGRRLHINSTGNGFWTFASSPAAMPVNFTSIERFNHVDVTAAVETLPNQSPVITVRDSETGEIKYQVAPYPGVTGPASVAVGDLNYDGIPDLAVAPGSNLPAVVTLFNGTPDANAKYPHAELAKFQAFAVAFRTGISMGIGDLNADGANELVVGAGSGSGGGYQPTVQVFDGQTILTGTPAAAPPQVAGAPFLAFEPSFTGGVNVSVGDLDNDGREDVLATRQSGPATVSAFSYTGSAFPLERTFTAFTPSVNGGLTNAVGDFDGDGWNDIVLGSGSGGAPGLMIYQGGTTLFNGSTAAPSLLKSFAPTPSSFQGGVIATATPVNGGDPGTIERVYVTANLVGTSSFQRYVAPPIAGGPTPILPTVPGSAITTPVLVGYTTYAVGADVGGPGTVNEYSADGSVVNSIDPFPGTTGGVRTAVADFNNDGVPDIAAGTGPGAVAQVKVFDGATGKVLYDVTPFEQFTGGVFIAAGDITGDGLADLVITPDLSGGPRVSIFRGGDFKLAANFFGIDDANFRGGARAAVGDIDGDGFADLVVSAGFGGGPRLSVYDGESLAAGNSANHLMPDFFLFEQALRNGAYVAVGDVDGDGQADIIGGGGPGGGPRVLILSGAELLTGGTAAAFNDPVANYFGGDVANRGGIRVAVKDLDGDEFADVVTGSGQNGGAHVSAYLGRELQSGSAFDAANFDAFDNFTGGVFVG